MTERLAVTAVAVENASRKFAATKQKQKQNIYI